VVAIGSSAGGPAALRVLLESLPADLRVPVLVAQHIAAGFEGGLVDWLQARCRLPLRLAEDARPLLAGEVVVGRPGTDLGVGPSRTVSMKPAGERGYHPSVDWLFSSVASAYGAASLAVVLSGTGGDGRQGAADVVGAGGTVMAQDEHSAAVDGMPRAVREAGLATVVGEPVALAAALLRRCRGTLESSESGESVR